MDIKLLTHWIESGQTDRFYKQREWKRRRQEVFRLDNYECQSCKRKGRHKRAEVVHHVKHLKDRPDLALAIWDGEERQLISLCRGCHELEHPERIQNWKYERRGEPLTVERWD